MRGPLHRARKPHLALHCPALSPSGRGNAGWLGWLLVRSAHPFRSPPLRPPSDRTSLEVQCLPDLGFGRTPGPQVQLEYSCYRTLLRQPTWAGR